MMKELLGNMNGELHKEKTSPPPPLAGSKSATFTCESLHHFKYEGFEVVSVKDDPNADKPFQIGYKVFTKAEAAMIAHSILAILRTETASDAETENEIDGVQAFLRAIALLHTPPW
jgi:hypothetical protein